MKIQETGIDVHSRGVQGRSQYTIAQSAKMMEMLSNMLYKDKVKAPIRELSTNAWDAHIMAGTTSLVPEMHLPNHQDSEFRLRDFGTGLSPDDLENMYTTYGESNKSHSNDFNGCMGIGSKSPFAYVRSFTTTSYYSYAYLPTNRLAHMFVLCQISFNNQQQLATIYSNL